MSVTSPGAGTVRLRPGRRAEAERARQRMVQGRSTPVKPLPEKKVFCKQNPEIPSLPPEDYKKDDYGDAYWATWPEPQWNNCKILQVGRICFVMSIPFAGPYLGKDYGH